MTEAEFSERLREILRKNLDDRYEVRSGANLIYRVIVNPKGEFCPSNPDPAELKRGSLAFQTDVLVQKKENNIPLVVVETKLGGFSTHDVLTYSSKAVKHKEIYPYLRYGLVVGDVSIIPNKFFTHNVGFDFALALEDVKKLDAFLPLIKEQIECAELLLANLDEQNTTKLFSSNIKIVSVKQRR